MQTDYVLVHDARLNWQNKKLQTQRAWSTTPLMFGDFLRNIDARHRTMNSLSVCMPLISIAMYVTNNAWTTTPLKFADFLVVHVVV